MAWRVGFSGDVVGAPGFADDVTDVDPRDNTDDQQSLWAHVRMTFNMLSHVLLFSTLPSSPPWSS